MNKVLKFTCKVCHKKSRFHPILIQQGRKFLLKCPKCFRSGVVKNKDYVPFLFVKKISLAPRTVGFGILRTKTLLK